MTGDIDGFFLMCEDLGRMFDHFFPPALFVVVVVVVSVDIGPRTLISLFSLESVHSGSAS